MLSVRNRDTRQRQTTRLTAQRTVPGDNAIEPRAELSRTCNGWKERRRTSHRQQLTCEQIRLTRLYARISCSCLATFIDCSASAFLCISRALPLCTFVSDVSQRKRRDTEGTDVQNGLTGHANVTERSHFARVWEHWMTDVELRRQPSVTEIDLRRRDCGTATAFWMHWHSGIECIGILCFIEF